MSLTLETTGTRTNLLAQSLKEHFKIDLPHASGLLFYNGRLKEKNVGDKDVFFEQQEDFHCIQVNSNKFSELPLFLIHVLDCSFACEPNLDNVQKKRLNITAGKHVNLIECCIHLDSTHSGHSSLSKHYMQSEIVLEDRAHANHVLYLLGQNKSAQALENTITQFSLSRYKASLFSFNLLDLKANVTLCLTEEKAAAEFQSLILAKKNQKHNLSLVTHHLSSACQSNVLVRGVIDEKAEGSFSGKIIIEKEAAASKASLENKNILLSEYAKMNTQPLLEIYNHDIIKCSHGATVGNLDPDALFYLKSRGLSEALAKQILIEGFIKPTLAGLPACILPIIEACIYEH